MSTVACTYTMDEDIHPA